MEQFWVLFRWTWLLVSGVTNQKGPSMFSMIAYLPVIEFFAGEVKVLIQWVCLIAFPVLQLYLKHIAMPIGQLWDKLVPQPVLSQRAPEPLQPRAVHLVTGCSLCLDSISLCSQQMVLPRRNVKVIHTGKIFLITFERKKQRSRGRMGEYVAQCAYGSHQRLGFLLHRCICKASWTTKFWGITCLCLSFYHRITDKSHHVRLSLSSGDSNSGHHTCTASILCMGHIPSSGNRF